MSINITIRPTTRTEDMYTYTQSTQIQGQTGCIGHLRADMDTSGEGFFSSWDDHRGYLKTDEFKAEFDQVINRLRFGAGDENGIRHEDGDCFLKNRSALAQFCWSQPSARMKTDEENYGFRVDTDSYSYMMRLNPNNGEYNLYCYCYRRDWLDQHLRDAERGIRFIDSHYNDLFRIEDGGKVRVTYSDGEVREVICRYIDEYHLEFGFGSCNLLHICELAENLEKNGDKVEPISATIDVSDVDRIRREYPAGTRVRVNHMVDDPRPVPDGSLGTVEMVDDIGSIHVSWDCGSSLALIPGVDVFEKIL